MRMPGAVIWDQDIRDQVRRTEASGHNVSGVWAVMGSIWNVRGQDPTPAHVYIEKSRHVCPISRTIRAAEQVDSGYVFNAALKGRCDDNCH